MSRPSQSFANHAKMVPLYHYWTTLFLIVPTVYFGVLVSLAMLGGLAGNLVLLPVLLKLTGNATS